MTRAAILILLIAWPAQARDPAVVRQFKKLHPCPQELWVGKRCMGVVDHVEALACGGRDDVSNLQWQSIAEGKAKDRWERIGCRKGAVHMEDLVK